MRAELPYSGLFTLLIVNATHASEIHLYAKLIRRNYVGISFPPAL